MTTESAPDIDYRRRTVRMFLLQGLLGFAVVAGVTWSRWREVPEILAALEPLGWTIVVVCVAFLALLASLRFQLAPKLSVSMVLAADIAMFPLLGPVVTAWIAVIVPVVVRWVEELRHDPLEKSSGLTGFLGRFRFFATYGVPVVAASLLYEAMGGGFPLARASAEDAVRIAAAGIVLIVANSLLMEWLMMAYGYPFEERLRLALVDASIYVVSLPYAICTTFALVEMGLGGFLALAFSGVLINFVARRLAQARVATRQQLQRLASLSQIGKTISLQFTTEELLMTIYRECRKVVDASMFSIALLDETTGELSFELDIRDGERKPRERIPLGSGLNSWVVQNHRSLLIGSIREEQKRGIVSVEDGLATQSWLGVPMISRDRVIGVIAVQAYTKNAFSEADQLLLASIASQAAAALENASLYRDLEGLTQALEQRVEERTLELSEMNLRLLAAGRSKNQFLANMSHELRTPLNSIIGFSEVLRQESPGRLSPKKQMFLDNIRVAGHHLLTLINDILDLSKIDAGKMQLLPEEFDVGDVLRQIELSLREMAENAGVRLVFEIDPTIGAVRLDEVRFRQIFFNIVSNAIKFSPGGGGVRVTAERLDSGVAPLGVESLRVIVSDQGIGMSEQELQKIFDEFYQTEQGRRTRQGGTGLGLSLARNFVQLHGGTIEAASQPGKGSTFTVNLPLDMSHSPMGAVARPSRARM